jgi:beta-glucosidase
VPYINAKIIPANKRNVPYTDMNWEIYPKSIYYMILKYSEYEDIKRILITESGAAFKDEHKAGKVNDKERMHYLQSYLEQVHHAKEKGGKVDGYFVWSLMDNFEWAEGYHKRFGLVHVNFETQERTVKNSGHWYREFLDKKE